MTETSIQYYTCETLTYGWNKITYASWLVVGIICPHTQCNCISLGISIFYLATKWWHIIIVCTVPSRDINKTTRKDVSGWFLNHPSSPLCIRIRLWNTTAAAGIFTWFSMGCKVPTFKIGKHFFRTPIDLSIWFLKTACRWLNNSL